MKKVIITLTLSLALNFSFFSSIGQVKEQVIEYSTRVVMQDANIKRGPINFLIRYANFTKGTNYNPELFAAVIGETFDKIVKDVLGGITSAGTLKISKHYIEFVPYPLEDLLINEIKSIKIPRSEVKVALIREGSYLTGINKLEIQTMYGSLICINPGKNYLQMSLGFPNDTAKEIVRIVNKIK